MKLEKYEFEAKSSHMLFEFVSDGPKGKIIKVVSYSETNLKGFYNLLLGDQGADGSVDDLANSGNGDAEKVLATVVSTLYSFTDKYPDYWVYALGGDEKRTRLYRMGINKYLTDISNDFIIFGLTDGQWKKFRKNGDYSAFLAKRKIINSNHEKR